MSVSPIITRGFGSFSTAFKIPTFGFAIGEAASIWTPIAAAAGSWANQSAASGTWTPQAAASGSWTPQ
ncbi:hypothetical protein IAI19_11685 [Streptococcus pseudopneumoniae]|nr:hypothetical protein [Streptococcus pseudopneumoniae]